VPRLFDELAESVPPSRVAYHFGQNHMKHRKKVQRLLEEDFEERKRAAARLRDGHVKRAEVEAAVAAKGPSLKCTGFGRSSPFSEVPLLSASEAAVRWYTNKGAS
jgi:hypothetical protein